MESTIKSLHLAQLWHLRFERMLSLLPKRPSKEPSPIFLMEFFEAVGWLAEGVFCGYFDPYEANVILVRIAPLREFCGNPKSPLGKSLSGAIWSLDWSRDPFRETLQMTNGPQKEFELPLFGYALFLGDRFFDDRLAGVCTECIYRLHDERWTQVKHNWPSVKPAQVDEKLCKPQNLECDTPNLSAGYIRLLEHMNASQEFFKYAKSQSGGADFESYLLRIGALNGWRVPLDIERFAHRFYELRDLLEFTLRNALLESRLEIEWSTLGNQLAGSLKDLAEGWESHHLLGSLVTQ